MNIIDAKLLHYSLNLDYSQNEISKENQANLLINHLMNEFAFKFQKDFKDKQFVLEFQNDTFSLIAYNILKNIQSVFDFSLLIYGKHAILKSYLKTHNKKNKEKFIGNFTFNKLKKQNKMILISCYNPIYQVANSAKSFKEFKTTFNLLESFTPDELQIAKDFYSIPSSRADDIYFKNLIATAFNVFCNGKERDDFCWRNFKIKTPKEIYIIKLEGDNKKDNELVNEVVDTDGLIFYECEKEIKDYPILLSEYQYYLKNKSNIPGYWNINTYSIPKTLMKENNIKIDFVGNVDRGKWTNEK